MHRDDDDAWQAIVDNYGERAELDPDPAAGPDLDEPRSTGAPDGTDSTAEVDDPRDVIDPRTPREGRGTWAETYSLDASGDAGSPGDAGEAPRPASGDDRFVPPPPPPVPATTADRYAAWAGVFGAPALLLVSIVLGVDLPEILGYALVAAFVGGFLYLVLRMPREPRDPGDDGARL